MGITVAFNLIVMKTFGVFELRIGMVRQCHSDFDVENRPKESKGG